MLSWFNKNHIGRVLVIGLFLLLNIAPVSIAFANMDASQKSMITNKPGVVFISTYYKFDLIIQSSSGYADLAGKTYTIEAGATGSGFVINPDGYILTNGHVVNIPEKQLVTYGLESISNQLISDIITIEYQKENGVAPTESELNTAVPAAIENLGGQDNLVKNLYASYLAGQVKLDNSIRGVYIQQGEFVSGKKVPVENGIKADVRYTDFTGFADDGEVIGKDIAILKVSATSMPTVLLGNSSTTQMGDNIYILGYPSAATFQDFLGKESQLEPTMTTGSISSLKSMKDGSQIIQTDAAISYGSSGGPAFNSKGEVIGIASMVATEQGEQKFGFSYLRPINIAKEFLNEQNISSIQGPTDLHYKNGINYFEKNQFKNAIKELETSLRLYPNLLEAKQYIQKSQEGLISTSFSFSRISDYVDNTILIIIALILMLLTGAIMLLTLLKKEKKMEAQVESLEHPNAHSKPISSDLKQKLMPNRL